MKITFNVTITTRNKFVEQTTEIFNAVNIISGSGYLRIQCLSESDDSQTEYQFNSDEIQNIEMNNYFERYTND